MPLKEVKQIELKQIELKKELSKIKVQFPLYFLVFLFFLIICYIIIHETSNSLKMNSNFLYLSISIFIGFIIIFISLYFYKTKKKHKEIKRLGVEIYELMKLNTDKKVD